MTDPAWLAAARLDVGQRETAPNDSPWIRRMLQKLNASWLLGQPWCGGAVAAWMQTAGCEIPKHWYRARDWADWGQPLDHPAHGCVVVLSRAGGGHVGLLVGEDASGRLLLLGGNQGDAVNVRAFGRERVMAYRWPAGRERPAIFELARASAPLTTGEA